MRTLRISGADAGDFANGRLAWDVLNATARHNSELPDVLDLSGSVMLRPYALACLIALAARASRTMRLVMPKSQECADHLRRIGFQRFFSDPAAEALDPRGTNVVAERVDTRSSDFANRVMGSLTNHLRYSSNEARDLANHLDELVLNALTHADSPIGCVVVGQAFPTNHTIEIAVVDLGCTIPVHLRRNPAYASLRGDAEAIERATEEAVTGTVGRNRWGEPNSGVGLYELRRFCECGRGHLAILSGGACVCFSNVGAPARRAFRGGFAGCLVNVQFLPG